MKIGYDAKYLWAGKSHSSKSGHGVHATELLKCLIELDHDNEYLVYVIERGVDIPAAKNFQTVELPGAAQSSVFRNLVSYPVELWRRPVQLLMAYTTIPAFTRCSTMLFLADISWIVHPEWFPRAYVLPIRPATRRSVDKADVIVTTTEFSKRQIVEYLDVPEERIEIVPHGIRTEILTQVDDARVRGVRRKYGLEGDYILSVNDMHQRKNLHRLFAAFSKLKREHRIPHKLALVGRRLWEYPELFEPLEHSPHRSDVVMPGFVENDELRPLYQGASLFVYPSLYEGWGLQAHEAMSCGTPVAVSNNTTLAEICGDAAAQFDPHEVDDMSAVILRTLQDREYREALRLRGYQQIRKFDWMDAAKKVLRILERFA